MKPRRKARAVALQALFEIDSVGHDPERVLEERLRSETLPQEGHAFTRNLVWGVHTRVALLDKVIQKLAPEWPVEQLAFIDRNILRMAIFEIATADNVPVKVVINEAVELAKLFGSESSRRFVNGVVGTLIAQIESDGGEVNRLMEKLGQREESLQGPEGEEIGLA